MMAELPSSIRPRLAQLVRLLASPHDGEVVASARALRRTLDANGLDLDDFAGVVEREPVERVVFRDRPARPRGYPAYGDRPRTGEVMIDFGRRCTIVAALRRGFDGVTYTSFEAEFAQSMIVALQNGGRLTAKQYDILGRILGKVGEGRP